MSQYYFDICQNGHVAKDQTGTSLASDAEAYREAVRTLAAIAAEEIPKDGRLDLSIAVADRVHRHLFTARVSFEPGTALAEAYHAEDEALAPARRLAR
ncbi:MAG: hypothetical protein P0Y65_14350 [Candidatus Devosia phytovorans]|uniref:DUF6894 domain-containing protein n=1 Tax=Candidatus Devosia phytovorans TaxID=3121372 RepID=A0AAJ6AZR2_9HYPH|nr:hypothetical protein [Devosia sp.]WEK03369.1 MAG: hypothetical protein P0Y65_14350 [Devosia sp.]